MATKHTVHAHLDTMYSQTLEYFTYFGEQWKLEYGALATGPLLKSTYQVTISLYRKIFCNSTQHSMAIAELLEQS